ncbi:MAG: hypothetical protein H6727_19000 [Myxococcales bacterium]|nr:hypothetical protein [Myxococcales bacterium]
MPNSDHHSKLHFDREVQAFLSGKPDPSWEDAPQQIEQALQRIEQRSLAYFEQRTLEHTQAKREMPTASSLSSGFSSFRSLQHVGMWRPVGLAALLLLCVIAWKTKMPPRLSETTQPSPKRAHFLNHSTQKLVAARKHGIFRPLCQDHTLDILAPNRVDQAWYIEDAGVSSVQVRCEKEDPFCEAFVPTKQMTIIHQSGEKKALILCRLGVSITSKDAAFSIRREGDQYRLSVKQGTFMLYHQGKKYILPNSKSLRLSHRAAGWKLSVQEAQQEGIAEPSESLADLKEAQKDDGSLPITTLACTQNTTLVSQETFMSTSYIESPMTPRHPKETTSHLEQTSSPVIVLRTPI